MAIDKDTIQNLLNDIESDRVERTRSVNNTDKFGQAICAFANDLPNHKSPGYLIIGPDDKTGKLVGVPITDELLKNLSGIRTNGNIQPQPSMIVEKVELDEGPVAVVEVQPSPFPPIRYKGHIWVRIGPRKGVANEQDEKILLEKRNSQAVTFDALPCLRATIDDIDTQLFLNNYLPKAFPADVITEDKRDVKHKMQALGFFDTRYNCPTNAGILMFGNNVERFLPGAYIQYVKFKGKGRGGDIEREYKFSGNLMKVLYQLDTFVDTTITNRRPIPVSVLREDTIVDYPHWATRELLMNAICHRTYDSNGPIQFYQYDDRIEIQNHGGLYGKANPENFPHVNDYRNSIIAEALRVLGFVNRFSRGVQRVEDDLKENGNGLPEFDLTLGTAFKVIERKSTIVETVDGTANDTVNGTVNGTATNAANGTTEATDYKYYSTVSIVSEAPYDTVNDTIYGTANGTVNGTVKSDPTTFSLSDVHRQIFYLICMNDKISYEKLEGVTLLSRRHIARIISDLKKHGYIARRGSDKSGSWEIRKSLTDK